MERSPGQRPTELSAERRQRLLRLLSDALHDGYAAAAAAGADEASLARDIQQRQRSLVAAADTVQGGVPNG